MMGLRDTLWMRAKLKSELGRVCTVCRDSLCRYVRSGADHEPVAIVNWEQQRPAY